MPLFPQQEQDEQQHCQPRQVDPGNQQGCFHGTQHGPELFLGGPVRGLLPWAVVGRFWGRGARLAAVGAQHRRRADITLYGATGGKAFINGVAGERFCVRNSGGVAVVEGVGDHGCEYMTGGTVVVLGKTCKNFAAGMSGGIAYVLDEDWDFYQRVNKDMVSLEPVEHKYDVSLLKDLIREHVELTGSPRGKEILDNFGEYLPKFKKVLPHDYDKMLRLIAQMEEKGEDSEQAQIEAFYAMKSAK